MKILLLAILSLNFSIASIYKIQKEFKNFYYSNEVNDRLCQENTIKFVKHLSDKGLFDTRIRLVSMEAPTHAWTFGRLPAFNSRFGKEIDGMFHQNWGYHFFMILENKVYDFSFDDKPRLLSLKKYMDEMYLPTNDIMINGSSFRTRNMGPYLTREIAKTEREDFLIQVYETNENGDKIIEGKDLSYKRFLNFGSIR